MGLWKPRPCFPSYLLGCWGSCEAQRSNPGRWKPSSERLCITSPWKRNLLSPRRPAGAAILAWNGMPVVGWSEATLFGDCPDKLRKMAWGVAEGWQLAAPRMGVPIGFRGSRNEGIKITMNIWRHKNFIFKQSNTSLKCVSPPNLFYSYWVFFCFLFFNPFILFAQS